MENLDFEPMGYFETWQLFSSVGLVSAYDIWRRFGFKPYAIALVTGRHCARSCVNLAVFEA